MKELAAIRKIFSSLIEHRMAKKSRVSNSLICSIFFWAKDCFILTLWLFSLWFDSFFHSAKLFATEFTFQECFQLFPVSIESLSTKVFYIAFFSSLHSAHNDSVCFLLVENEFFSHAIKVFPVLLKRVLLSLFFLLA